jgi:predicted amidohydrolase YtcJ
MALAGITRETSDPAGGKILRDQSGAPTGVFIDNAIDLVAQKLPAPKASDLERWIVEGLAACADVGLVAVHDMGMSLDAVRVLMKLDDEHELPLRVFAYLDGTDAAAYDLLGSRPASDRLAIVGVKLYADGAMGSRGAALLEAYADDAGNAGLLLTEPKELEKRIARAHAKGFAVAVHAIGDRGNRIVLDAMQRAPAPAGVRDRIEHAQLVAPSDFARFALQHVVASMQPTHATSDMRWAEERVGPQRVTGAYAWRTMLSHGTALAFGSDAPVEDERPALGVYAAITRADSDGQPAGGFMPAQKLTQTQALAAFASGASFAVAREQHLGALTPGMFFDVTLFADDAARKTDAGDATAWLRTRPVGTVVGGVLREARK